MQQKTIQHLENLYRNTCEDILKAFCDKYGLHYENDAWFAGEVGTIANIADFLIDFQDIRLMLNQDVTWEVFLKWYDYCLEVADLNITPPNLRAWVRGCPRVGDDALKKIRDQKQTLEELTKEAKKSTDSFSF